MSDAENKITVTPSPERLVESLTSLGHSFSTAVADLVDNSIEAGSSEISIWVRFDGKRSAVRISDNGRGMNIEEMKEAMRFGTRRDYDLSALGKYGLGLKTASLSQCRKLTVASRTSDDKSDVCAMSWDMEHLKKSKQWEVLQIQESDLDENILRPLRKNTGTVVYWSQIKDISEYKDPKSGWAKRRMSSMCRELENYLAMVFHRFLEGEEEGRTVKIKLNEIDIKAWDPFARNEQHTRPLSSTFFEVKEEGSVEDKVVITPYILPHRDKFSSQEAFKKASGPASWNQQQGFYIYRVGRMIQSGGWCNMRTADEHTKLARIALQFPPSLDDVFNINIAKMKVDFPDSLKEKIKSYVVQIAKAAQTVYRQERQKDTSSNYSTISYGNKVDCKEQNQETRIQKKWTFNQIVVLLRGVASRGELPVLDKIIQRVRENIGE